MLTLSAELTFRDYAQAAYRMRGIGKGQTLLLLVTPEVASLVAKEAAIGQGVSPQQRASQLGALPEEEARRGALEDVCGWLVINSMRTERLQFEVWAMHCARNAWRKKAMARLCATHAAFGGDNAGRAAMPALSAQSLDLFREEVDHDVSNSVPRAVDSATAIRAAAAAHAALLPAPEDSSAIEVVLGLLAGFQG